MNDCNDFIRPADGSKGVIVRFLYLIHPPVHLSIQSSIHHSISAFFKPLVQYVAAILQLIPPSQPEGRETTLEWILYHMIHQISVSVIQSCIGNIDACFHIAKINQFVVAIVKYKVTVYETVIIENLVTKKSHKWDIKFNQLLQWFPILVLENP